LEFFLHQSILLRLNNIVAGDPFLPPKERLHNLRRSHDFSLIVQSTNAREAEKLFLAS
jgi:hypothetical protein